MIIGVFVVLIFQNKLLKGMLCLQLWQGMSRRKSQIRVYHGALRLRRGTLELNQYIS